MTLSLVSEAEREQILTALPGDLYRPFSMLLASTYNAGVSIKSLVHPDVFFRVTEHSAAFDQPSDT